MDKKMAKLNKAGGDGADGAAKPKLDKKAAAAAALAAAMAGGKTAPKAKKEKEEKTAEAAEAMDVCDPAVDETPAEVEVVVEAPAEDAPPIEVEETEEEKAARLVHIEQFRVKMLAEVKAEQEALLVTEAAAAKATAKVADAETASSVRVWISSQPKAVVSAAELDVLLLAADMA